MKQNGWLDSYLRKHPVIFTALVIVVAAFAIIVLIGASDDVGLVYKAF